MSRQTCNPVTKELQSTAESTSVITNSDNSVRSLSLQGNPIAREIYFCLAPGDKKTNQKNLCYQNHYWLVLHSKHE